MKRLFITLSILSVIFLLTLVHSSQAAELADRLKGKILLQVEDKGKAYYVDPTTKQRAYLGYPADAFRIMRELGLGIKHDELQSYLDTQFPKRLAGKILLDVESRGEAYYVFPDDLKGYYLGKPADAFKVMREKGLGIKNDDLAEVPVFQKYKEKVEQLAKKIEQIEGGGQILGEEVKKQSDVISKQQEQIIDLQKQVKELAEKPTPTQTVPTEVVNNPTNNLGVVEPPKPTPTLSVTRGRNNTLVFQATEDDFVIEAISVASDEKSYINLGKLQLRECISLNGLWLEFSGVPYPIECATQGFYQTDWMGRQRTDALRINNKQTMETSLTVDSDKNVKVVNGVIKYLRAVGVNTGTVVILKDDTSTVPVTSPTPTQPQPPQSTPEPNYSTDITISPINNDQKLTWGKNSFGLMQIDNFSNNDVKIDKIGLKIENDYGQKEFKISLTIADNQSGLSNKEYRDIATCQVSVYCEISIPDFTIEKKGIFRPDYTQKIVYLTFADIQLPYGQTVFNAELKVHLENITFNSLASIDNDKLWMNQPDSKPIKFSTPYLMIDSKHQVSY